MIDGPAGIYGHPLSDIVTTSIIDHPPPRPAAARSSENGIPTLIALPRPQAEPWGLAPMPASSDHRRGRRSSRP